MLCFSLSLLHYSGSISNHHCSLSNHHLHHHLIQYFTNFMMNSSSPDLVLRVSRQANNDDLRRLYSAFEAVAKEMKVDLEVIPETVNIMEEHRTYPHERFALRRLTAGTLTSAAKSMF